MILSINHPRLIHFERRKISLFLLDNLDNHSLTGQDLSVPDLSLGPLRFWEGGGGSLPSSDTFRDQA